MDISYIKALGELEYFIKFRKNKEITIANNSAKDALIAVCNSIDVEYIPFNATVLNVLMEIKSPKLINFISSNYSSSISEYNRSISKEDLYLVRQCIGKFSNSMFPMKVPITCHKLFYVVLKNLKPRKALSKDIITQLCTIQSLPDLNIVRLILKELKRHNVLLNKRVFNFFCSKRYSVFEEYVKFVGFDTISKNKQYHWFLFERMSSLFYMHKANGQTMSTDSCITFLKNIDWSYIAGRHILTILSRNRLHSNSIKYLDYINLDFLPYSYWNKLIKIFPHLAGSEQHVLAKLKGPRN
ncbi:hypothetical protein Paride_0153 [Pseudomonas phage Paride]|nr:hypothetical protein Deiofobo_0153 [Pseudomonas phage Deifobo]WPK40383.1 hypothetical protein Paride_0153 [Pseudomonas phage Paride]